MKKHLRHWAIAVVGTAAAIAFTSCTYDPYYPGYSSVGGSYSSGYGEGYGYGGSHFSTSVFVGTGDPRWGYDPYCYSYYDYNRHCYYDPYLNGYYPVGYRPAVIIGAPHPYGWHPGSGYCPPPRVIRNVTVVNYHNREAAYRNSNYGWAKQVRQQPVSQGRVQGQHPDRNTYNRPNTGTRPAYGNSNRESQGRNPYSQNSNQGAREQRNGRPPAGYNTTVNTHAPQQGKPGQRNGNVQNQPRQSPPNKAQGGNRNGNRQAQPAPQRGRQEGTHPGNDKNKRDVRGLGDG